MPYAVSPREALRQDLAAGIASKQLADQAKALPQVQQLLGGIVDVQTPMYHNPTAGGE